MRRLLPVGVKADTAIILKTGDVILGHIVAEDKTKLVIEVSLTQGSCTMDIEKPLIQSIARAENKNK